MKKLFCYALTIIALTLTGCDGNKRANSTREVQSTTLSREEIKKASFGELFIRADVKEIPTDVFTLVGENFTVITAGDIGNYNSMVASWGGWGILFNKPTTWNMLRANRYTLEYIRDKQSYTMSYFDHEYKSDIMLFGTKSGIDTDKMKESELTAVVTPSGNITFKEAFLVIECVLTEITTVSPDDYYTEEGYSFVIEAYEEAGEYHKLVLGEITAVWKRN